MSGSHCLRRFVGAILPTWRPEHDQCSASHVLHAQDGEVRGLDHLAVRQKLALNFVELLNIQTCRREKRLTVCIRILPNHHIAAAKILKVIGKGAKCANDAIRVPACLVFDSLAFHSTLVQEIGEVDWELTHRRVILRKTPTQPGSRPPGPPARTGLRSAAPRCAGRRARYRRSPIG